MTEALLKYKQNKLLFLDIETARGQEKLDVKSDLFKAFQWKMRDQQTLKLPTQKETIELYNQKAALYPVYGKIVTITIGIVTDDEKIILKSFSGDEKQLLKDFVDTAKTLVGYTTVIWNAAFDMPYIRKRFLINGLTNYLSTKQGNDSMEKPWTVTLLDLMTAWKGIAFSNEGLDEVALSFGLKSPKDDIKGSEVSDTFYRGEIDRIVTYCQKDVETLINLYRIFTYRKPITDVVIRGQQETDSDLSDKLPLMQAIYMEETITKENELKLLDLVKDFTDDEKDKTLEILSSVLFGTEINPLLIEKIKKA